MDGKNNESEKQMKFHVAGPGEAKGKNSCGRNRLIIIGIVVVIIVLIIILGVVLGVTLNRDESSEASPNRLAEHPVILISLDGFRVDYLKRGLTPNITNLGKTGVQANFMMSQFPTKTFPNHYTAVTGLYPESHGIVFNSFYDPVLKSKFSIPKSKNPLFWKSGEPIWITAKKNGMKTASYFWVGSEVKGQRPTYYRDYNSSVPFSDRVNQAFKWLQLPREKRPSLITLYFNEPDRAGHYYGPNSAEVNKQLKVVDDTIGQLLNGLDEMNMTNTVNVILISDHGMAETNCSDTILLPKYGVYEKNVNWTNLGAVAAFNTIKGVDRQEILDKLKCSHESFQAFYKKNLPKRMHFSNNRRIDDTIVIGEPGKLIGFNQIDESSRYCSRGAHGYDNIVQEMRPIFMAKGPSFKKGKTVRHFYNIEIYNMLAALLKIKPSPNNGTFGSLHGLLMPDKVPSLSKPSGDGNNFRTDICKFPSDKVFEERSKSTICRYCRVSRSNASEFNKVFNVTSGQANAYQMLHLPWGLPEGGDGVEGCLMTQPDFIIGYSTYLRIPLWTANRINGTLSSHQMTRQDCFRGDVRLKPTETGNCKSYTNSGFDRGHLVPNSDLDFDATSAMSSFTFANIVPQYPKFNRGIWVELERMVRSWAEKYKEVYVISGSIFDDNGDGLRDSDKAPKKHTNDNPQNPAIPTHFYKIITRCNSGQKSEHEVPGCEGSLDVLSFILRNTNEVCKQYDRKKLLLRNVARVKDIELLTGINFFPELPAQLQAEIETFLPVELWQ